MRFNRLYKNMIKSNEQNIFHCVKLTDQILLKIRFPNIGPTYRTMITSSNGHIFTVTGHLCGEFTGDRWISHTKASDAELWCFPLICALYKRLSKWPWGWWFETPRAHYDVTVMVSGKSTASNTTKTLCYNAWNSNFEYPNSEYRFEIKDPDGNRCSIQYPKRRPGSGNITGG